MSGAYYNEIDEYAAQWLRNLTAAGHIAPGDVDARSIEDVRPDDLHGYAQCHFFAGIGIWSHSLRLAGVPDSMPLWTGSCPCQPFSAAGKGAGFADERHLWPAWHHLIGEHRPAVIFGEQVASKDAEPWLDLVQDDMEALGYAFAAVPFPAASVGAPHIRDRLYWVADANVSAGRQGGALNGGRYPRGDALARPGLGGSGVLGVLADSSSTRLEGCDPGALGHERSAVERGGEACVVGHAECVGTGRDTGAGAGAQSGSVLRTVGDDARPSGAACELADADGRHTSTERQQPSGQHRLIAQDGGPLRGFWANAEWIACRDGKWRSVEPGTFPLAHGAPARVGRLRAYGNAINAEAARVFIESVMECRP